MLLQDRYSRFLVLNVAIVALAACTASDDHAGITEDADATMDTLVSAAWLRENLDDPDLVVIDATVLIEPDESGNLRSVNGRQGYQAGHIPGSGFADLLGDLSDAKSPLGFAMPAPEQFAAAMEALGVGDRSRVVLYDTNGLSWAARVWWMLRWIGFDRAALLDGGLDAWKAEGGSLSTESAARPTGKLTVRLRPELIADQSEVRAAVEDESTNLIDALPAPHYRGEWAMYARPGHISGASNVPVLSLFDDTGRFLAPDELSALFDGDRDARTITYCGGGIAASADAFVMTRLGYTDVAVYAASLQEWAADADNPMDVVLDFDETEE